MNFATEDELNSELWYQIYVISPAAESADMAERLFLMTNKMKHFISYYSEVMGLARVMQRYGRFYSEKKKENGGKSNKELMESTWQSIQSVNPHLALEAEVVVIRDAHSVLHRIIRDVNIYQRKSLEEISKWSPKKKKKQ